MTNASPISASSAPLQQALAAVPSPRQRPAAAVASRAAAGRAPPARARAAAAKGSAGAAASAAKSASASSTSKSSSSKTGYATVKLPAEFAFLTDPKLSIEAKLSRFIGLMMARSEQRLLEQMEKMAAGSTGAAEGTSSSSAKGASSGSGSSSKSGFSLWSIAKALVPPLGLASELLGDSMVKSLIGQVSGPVLAAAATAIGLPALAPLALKLGPQLAKVVTSDSTAALDLLTGVLSSTAGNAAADRPPAPTAGKESSTSTSQKSSSSSSGSTTAKVTATEGSTSEKAQLLELQRLQDQDKELFSLFSNMLRAMHDARMTAIQNIR